MSSSSCTLPLVREPSLATHVRPASSSSRSTSSGYASRTASRLSSASSVRRFPAELRRLGLRPLTTGGLILPNAANWLAVWTIIFALLGIIEMTIEITSPTDVAGINGVLYLPFSVIRYVPVYIAGARPPLHVCRTTLPDAARQESATSPPSPARTSPFAEQRASRNARDSLKRPRRRTGRAGRSRGGRSVPGSSAYPGSFSSSPAPRRLSPWPSCVGTMRSTSAKA